MKLTPDTKTTTFSVYATEVGEIEYSIAPVEGYVMSEEYEYDSTKHTLVPSPPANRKSPLVASITTT